MARNIVPPPDQPALPPHSPTERVHPAYDAGLDPETQRFRVYPGKQARTGTATPVGPRPGPYMHSLVPRPGRWRGRVRTMLAALGGAAAALLVIAAIGIVLSVTDPAGDDPGAGATPTADDDVTTLEALSRSGRALSVTYSTPSDRDTTTTVPSGWTTDVPHRPGGEPVFTVSGSGDTAGQQDDTITCRVRHRGVVIMEGTATGSGASADCSGY